MILFSGCHGDGPTPFRPGGVDVAPEGQDAVGTVQLPAGCAIDAGSLKVLSCAGEFAVEADGSFAAREPDGGLAAVYVVDEAENLILAGFVDADDPGGAVIDARSTALVLLFQATGCYTFPRSAWDQVLDLLEQSPELDQVTAAIEGALAVNPHAVSEGDEAIRSALLAAAASLSPATATSAVFPGMADGDPYVGTADIVATRGSPTLIVVDGDNPQSGVHVGPNPDGDGIIFINSYRVHFVCLVFRTGHQRDDGSTVVLDQWELVEDMRHIKPAQELGGVVETVADALIAGKTPWEPVTTGPIDLTVYPQDAAKTFYKIVLFGPGAGGAPLPPGLQIPQAATHQQRMRQCGTNASTYTFMKEVLLPLLAMAIPGDFMKGDDTAFVTVADAMVQFATAGADCIQDISHSEYRDAIAACVGAIARSDAARELFFNILEKMAGTQAAGRFLSAGALQSVQKVVARAQVILGIIDRVMCGADLTRVVSHLAKAEPWNSWDATVGNPVVRITPDPAVCGIDDVVRLSCLAPAISGDTLKYHWWCNGEHGVLKHWQDEDTQLWTTDNWVQYNGNWDASNGDKETVWVKVWRVEATNTGTEDVLIGQADVEITIEDTDWIKAECRYMPKTDYTDPRHPGTYSSASAVYHVWTRVPGASSYALKLYTNVPLPDDYPEILDDYVTELDDPVYDYNWALAVFGGLNLWGIAEDELFRVSGLFRVTNFASQAQVDFHWAEEQSSWEARVAIMRQMTLYVRPIN